MDRNLRVLREIELNLLAKRLGIYEHGDIDFGYVNIDGTWEEILYSRDVWCFDNNCFEGFHSFAFEDCGCGEYEIQAGLIDMDDITDEDEFVTIFSWYTEELLKHKKLKRRVKDWKRFIKLYNLLR